MSEGTCIVCLSRRPQISGRVRGPFRYQPVATVMFDRSLHCLSKSGTVEGNTLWKEGDTAMSLVTLAVMYGHLEGAGGNFARDPTGHLSIEVGIFDKHGL